MLTIIAILQFAKQHAKVSCCHKSQNCDDYKQELNYNHSPSLAGSSTGYSRMPMLLRGFQGDNSEGLLFFQSPTTFTS